MRNSRFAQVMTVMATGVLGITLLLASGCTSTDSTVNTKAGAVIGALVGAGAGAIIGNQVGSGNPATGAAIGAAAGGLLGGVTGSAIDEKKSQPAAPREDRYR